MEFAGAVRALRSTSFVDWNSKVPHRWRGRTPHLPVIAVRYAPGVTQARLFTPAFGALFAAALVFFTSGSTVLPVASRFAAGPLGADSTGVGIAIGAFAIAALVLRPVVGWASDRFGRRPLLILGGLLTVGALVLHLVATTLPLFVLARSMLGIAEAFFFVAAVAAISDLAPPERRGEAMNVGSLALYLGLAFGPFIGETVLAWGGYATVWLVAATMAGVSTGLALLVPETAPGALRPRANGERPPRTRLIHPAGLFPGFLIMTGTWGMAGFLAFIPLYTTELGMGGAGPALALYALIVISLRIIFAKLPDQVGAARLSGVALIGSALGLGILSLIRMPIGVYLGTAVFASGIAFLFPALLALAVARVDEMERGSVVGTTTAFVDLSFGLSPALLGFAAGQIGFGGTFAISALIALGGSLLLVVRKDAIARPQTETAPSRLPG
jgi:MFS family permease